MPAFFLEWSQIIKKTTKQNISLFDCLESSLRHGGSFVTTHRLSRCGLRNLSSLLLLLSLPVGSGSLGPHRQQHTRPPCPSPSPGVCPSSCPLHQGCCPATSSSDALFSLVPWLGIKSMSPPLQGRFLTTGPWGKSQTQIFSALSSPPQSGYSPHLCTWFCQFSTLLCVSVFLFQR